jgi:hypothetical protein
MIEITILQYLNNQEPSARVYTEIPKEMPSKFFVLEKTGSSMENHIFRSTFAIKSYGESLYEAASMNEEIKDLMLDGLITQPEIASVELNSDYNFTDTTTKKYRYQAVFDIVHY